MPPEILRTIQTWEKGYVDSPNDKGGETKYGISRRAFPGEDIKNLTIDRACRLYEEHYYKPLHLDALASDRVRWKVFDISVLCGQGRAATMLQRALDRLDDGAINDSVTDDGVVGPQTIQAANKQDPGRLVEALKDEMLLHFSRICAADHEQAHNLLGWVRRAIDTAEELAT